MPPSHCPPPPPADEKPQPSADYVLALRASLDAADFAGTKIIVMDGGFDASEVALAQANASYRAAVHGAGLHYPCSNPQPEVEALGWDWWASEDQSRDPAWDIGGTYWGKILSQNYVVNNMTATISWSLIWSAYTNLVCNGAGLMRAHTPWSGNFEVSAPIWMSAHWTQFVQPGWRFLLVSGGGSGFLRDPANPAGAPAGTYVTLAPPGATDQVTIIAETLVNNDCIPRQYDSVQATFTLAGGFPGAGTQLQAWRTTRDAQFVRLADVPVGADGSFTVDLPVDSITTFSTVTGASKGGFPGTPIPPAAPWALPYVEDFATYPEDAMAKYFSDQGGSWAVRGGLLTMVAERDPGANAWAPNPDPLSQIGEETWGDYYVQADVTFNVTGPYTSTLTSSGGRMLAPLTTPPSLQREAVWRASQGLPAAAPLRTAAGASNTLQLAPCDSTDPAQSFLPTAAPGYLQNAVTGNCLEVNGCVTAVDLYQCVAGPSGSSCGAPAGTYPNLVWAYSPASGALASGMAGAPILSAFPNGTFAALPAGAAAAAAQAWDYNTSTGQLAGRGGFAAGQCLSVTPQQRYAKVCMRVGSFDGFTAAPIDALCLRVLASGRWEVVGPAGALLGSGQLPGAFAPTDLHRLRLGAAGPVLQAWVDGASVLQLQGVGSGVGNAALGCGWHTCQWHSFEVGPM